MCDSDQLSDIVLSYNQIIPSVLTDDFVKELQDAGIPIAVEQRKNGVVNSIEWLMPTAVVVIITEKYIGTLLQEAAKKHYPIIEKAIANLARKTGGMLISVTTSLLKVKRNPDVFSVYTVLKTGHRVKWLFESTIPDEDLEASVSGLFRILADQDMLAEVLNSLRQKYKRRFIMRFDQEKKTWLPWKIEFPPKRELP